MVIEETNLKDCFVIIPHVFEDNRGYFFESFNKNKFKDITGKAVDFVQDNESKSSKGVLRGLHFQIGAYEQSKLIRVVKGRILDVCVDLRKNEPSFGHYFSVELSDKNKKQVFIPKGFAHGFLVLEDNTVINYKCDNFYSKNHERGIIFNDTDLNINWNDSPSDLVLSEKDKSLPTLSEYLNENKSFSNRG
ncbi:dTDP-4-dehydrorhamnose 3,5-epimerase [Psychroserpens sp. SPM9]|uniref:dTDP-4-dehydrorhamnose 3,5-epimerase n=1 Tax=Psychroserpens sp. SPM9 TaxID=2975598 RepID=UPI0021A52E0E|nr:dTDP-4-dehydrorhamnose 3,5-epimerase [Psychroserpens sp. SPM9]MDG5491094.1 dTDP-4-dehydrorhamnose 3,5-epimerase [Psychroserpens sp. SPM9]